MGPASANNNGSNGSSRRRSAASGGGPSAARGSKLFVPYRAVGLITDGAPFHINRLGDRAFITTSIGDAFQVRLRFEVGRREVADAGATQPKSIMVSHTPTWLF